MFFHELHQSFYGFGARLFAAEPFLSATRKWRLSGATVILMYHELADDADDLDAWTVVKRSDFLRQMDYVRAEFDVVSLSEAISRMASERLSERPLAVVTFDDGDRGNRDVLLPIVEDLDLPVTVFVATGQVRDQKPYWFDRFLNALQTDEHVTVTLPSPWVRRVINKTRGG